jgi:hypothetical protein
MADVITSIGSNSSITTGTPSSCSGSSSPYTVAFPSAPSGVSIGDSVSLTDEITTYATFTYLVTDISGSSLTLKFLTESSGYTGDTSPCDIQKYDESYNPVQAPGTFKRTYSTITAWELDLDNTVIYSSGDDAIGECYKDSNFNEAFTINGGGTVGLDSVKLTAPAGQRHDGTAGSGVVNVYNSATQSTSVISRQNCTISFMEYHMGNNSVNNRACTVTTSAYTDIIFSQNIIHNLTGSFPIAIFFDDGNSSSDTRYCHNNLFYDIDDNDDRVKAVLVSGSYPLKVWNNTTYLIRTGSGSKNAYSFACDTASTAMEVKNCLAIMTSSTGTAGFALNYNSDSDYNGSDFSTATGGSNDLTSLTTAVFEDYDATPPEFALASGASPIDAGVDLGTTAGVNIGIAGRDRSGDSAWSMGAFQPIPTGTTVTPAAAQTIATGVSPTISSGLELTPATAVSVATGQAPTITSGQTLTPAVAVSLATGQSPTVSSGGTVTPAVAVAIATGTSPTITSGGTLTPAVAVSVATGTSPTLTSGGTVSPVSAVTIATGTDPTVTESESGDTVTPASAITIAAGTSPTITSGGTVTPSVSVVITTGVSPTLTSGGTITPSVAATVATGTSPTITSGITLSGIVAAAVATAQSPTITSDTTVTPSAAVIVVSASILPITPYGILYITDPMIRIPSVGSASIKTPSATSTIVSSKEE